jgi:ribosomal-protein-alanine N-acetyltransferase
MEVTLRKMTLDDLGEILELENELFSPPWSYNSFVAELESDKRSCLVAECQAKIIGYSIGAIFYDEVHIMSIGVTRSFQKSQVATKLMIEMINFAKSNLIDSIVLEVRASNKPAIGLYTKFGFGPVAVRRNYYTKPVEDALVLILNGVCGV